MSANFDKKLIKLLETDHRLTDQNGRLIKRAVIDKAWKTDHRLVRLLLGDSEIKRKFFDEIAGALVFNHNTLIDYISGKRFLGDSYTRFQNKIGLNIHGKFLKERGEVSLVWPYKDCVLEGGQTKEEESRKEIFFNEILAHDEINRMFDPKVLTNWKRHTANGSAPVAEIKRDKSGTIRENLIIKGNNLLALHTLKQRFQGKVKLIYIDPPYNTGSDSFKYNDSFNHSSWLTFMKNRLEAAKELLRKDGVIFVSLNHIELGYVSVLLDEIFGRANKLPIITLKAGTTASYRSINDCPVNISEYVLIYSKSSNFKPNQVYRETRYSEDYSHIIINFKDQSKNWKLIKLTDLIYKKYGCSNWKEYKKKVGSNWKRKRFEMLEEFALQNKEKVVSLNTLQKPSKKIQKVIEKSNTNRNKVFSISKDNESFVYCFNGRTLAFFGSKFRQVNGKSVPAEILTNIWTDVSFLGIGPEGRVTLKNGKKPEYLLKTIIELITDPGDIVLDYHLGSGTTAAVAHKMGRQYIGIEQLDYGKNDSLVRLKNVIEGDSSGISKSVSWQGGGDFIYCELKKYNEAYMDKIQVAKSSKELVSLWKDIAENSFLNWYVNPEVPQEAVNDFIAVGKEGFDTEPKNRRANQETFEKERAGKNLNKQSQGSSESEKEGKAKDVRQRLSRSFPEVFKGNSSGLERQKRLLAELLNKNQLYVNLSEIEDKDFNVSVEDKKLNKLFFNRS